MTVTFNDALKRNSVLAYGGLSEAVTVPIAQNTPTFFSHENFVANSVDLCNMTFTDNGKFTVLKDCCVEFVGDANLEVSVNNTRVTMELVKNGTEVLVGNYLDLTSQDNTESIGANKIMNLEAGDVLEVRATTNKAVNLSLSALMLSFYGFVEE